MNKNSGISVPFKSDLIYDPFRHFIYESYLSQELSAHILRWFSNDAPWEIHKELGFFEQYEFDLKNLPLPTNLNFLTSKPFIQQIAKTVEDRFEVALSKDIAIGAHKLETGQCIKSHTDFGENNHSYRFLIQINSGWRKENGGFLMLLDKNYLSTEHTAHKFYFPKNGSALAFEISERSYHAVSPVKEGIRYTLCYSFKVI